MSLRTRPGWLKLGVVPVVMSVLVALLLLYGSYKAAYASYYSYMGRPPDQIHLAWADDPTTTVTAIWHTYRDDTASIIRYRRAGDDEWRMEVGMPRPAHTRGVLHDVTLRNLEPDTRYEYQIKGDYYNEIWSDIFEFRTAPVEPSEFDAIYVADTGLTGRRDGLATGTQQIINEIEKLAPSLVLAGGDYAYYNKDKRYGSLSKSVDAWFNQMMPIAANAPMMPTYGNHEALLEENYGAWVERFATPEGFDHRRNYSFNIGPIHFISIFAIYEEQGLNPEVLEWLEDDIITAQNAGQQWIIPYMHVSAFAEGASHPSNLELRAQLGPLFERLGVKVVLSSHDQAYERTYPLVDVPARNRPTSTSKTCYTLDDGVTWVKSSPGGKKSNKSNDFSRFLDDPSPWVAVRNNTMHVFTQLRFTGSERLDVETFGMKGRGGPPVTVDAFYYTRGGCDP